MATAKIVPTERQRELSAFNLNDPHVVELINRAQESDAQDRNLTVRQALKKDKKAVFLAMILSTSLIMEGFDLTLVIRALFTWKVSNRTPFLSLLGSRSIPN